MTALRANFRPIAPRRHRLAPSAQRRAPRRAIGLWLPVTPLAVMFAPLALLAAPLLQLVLARRGFSPWRAVLDFGALLTALSGTIIEVDSPSVRIRIRIF